MVFYGGGDRLGHGHGAAQAGERRRQEARARDGERQGERAGRSKGKGDTEAGPTAALALVAGVAAIAVEDGSWRP